MTAKQTFESMLVWMDILKLNDIDRAKEFYLDKNFDNQYRVRLIMQCLTKSTNIITGVLSSQELGSFTFINDFQRLIYKNGFFNIIKELEQTLSITSDASYERLKQIIYPGK